MEFVCIEAKTFMEMNEALEAVVKKMCETCGSGISGFKNIGGVVSVTCKVYITDFTILHYKILHLPSTDKNQTILFAWFLAECNI